MKPLLAPTARHVLIASFALSGPTQTTVIVPPTASFKRVAISRAYVSKAFTIGVILLRSGAPVAGFIFTLTESSGTCLIQTNISIFVVLSFFIITQLVCRFRSCTPVV